MTFAGQRVSVGSSIELRADVEVELINGGEMAELLMLQGRPIGEPVAPSAPAPTQPPKQNQHDDADMHMDMSAGMKK